jgi:hypothetical protein
MRRAAVLHSEKSLMHFETFASAPNAFGDPLQTRGVRRDPPSRFAKKTGSPRGVFSFCADEKVDVGERFCIR